MFSLLPNVFLNYRMFKEDFKLENYLLKLSVKKYKLLCKFRCSNSKLRIETERWGHITRSERKCNLCKSNDIGDEFHYLFKFYVKILLFLPQDQKLLIKNILL